MEIALICVRCKRTVVAAFLAASAVAAASAPPAAKAQGLLGSPYVSGTYTMARPSDKDLQSISEWMYGASIQGNLPLTAMFDLNLDVGSGWFGGTTEIAATPVTFDTDITAFTALVNAHFFPDSIVDPFIGLGVGYTKFTFEANDGLIGLYSNEDDTSFQFNVGLERALTDRMALRTQIFSGDSIDNFDVEDVFEENLFVDARLINWWNDRWFSGIVIGSDFDDTDVELGFFLGYGVR